MGTVPPPSKREICGCFIPHRSASPAWDSELDAPVMNELPNLAGEHGRRVLHGSTPPQAAGATKAIG